MSEKVLTVKQVYQWIDNMAPFNTQMDYDNAGIITGASNNEVHAIHVAMDVTSGVLQEAEQNGADLIITHHPLMFGGRKNMLEDDYENRLICRMIRSNIAMIAAHTNLDQANGGINDVLAQKIGLENVTGEGYCRTGDLHQAYTGTEFSKLLSERLNTTVRVMGNADREIKRVTVASGAGSDEWQEMIYANADAFVTGEMKHHHGIAIAENGRTGFECGHFATEEPGIFALADALQKALNELQYKVPVTKSSIGAYA